MSVNVLKVLEERGLLEWCSDPQGLGELFDSQMVTGYIGFDPTADSLHVGHLIPIMGLAWLQRLGHKPIAIAGGGTGLIGDPSGKKSERPLLSLEDVERNIASIQGQLARFLDFECGKNSALMINNYDWLGQLKLLEFLRDVGKHFTINYMISREYVKSRLEDPERSISYTEFSYMLLQAYDFYHLCKNYDCRLQMGGNDQQGNIIAGIELIRKKIGVTAYGITYPLLLSSSGEKFGKSEGGAVWLSSERTTPYRFYQFWVNTDDRDVERLLKIYTFLPLEDIEEVISAHREHPEDRKAQKLLAMEVTSTVHGAQASVTAKRVSEILFGGDYDISDLTDDVLIMLSQEIPSGVVNSPLPIAVIDLMAESGAVLSKGEARRLIRGGGLYINGERVTEESAQVDERDFISGKFLLLRLGKKRFFMVRRST
ncbi:tyrosine--tRNA ligase [Acetomicrobium sp. S15 = DSM 107314]|uniref:tyrosine--tRNA ligase n=1 Tax=Acetomicrobium sp. S15 = DSM 107314 TaxID=2529858 RepID=UPI0018E15AF8|nr:tyrosine--tRNA ligase [Acetomicrobium sp. S15 = DSM 107314]